MSDVTEAVAQDMIADSLMSDDYGVLGSVNELFERTETSTYEPLEQEAPDYERESQEPKEQERETPEPIQELENDLRDEMAMQLADEQVQEQAESVSAYWGQRVEALQLNDPETATEFASNLAAMGGMALEDSGVDVKQLGHTMSKTALSVCELFNEYEGNLGNIPGIPEHEAQEFADDLLGAWGVDTRMFPNVDAGRLAATVFVGGYRILEACKAADYTTDMRKINSPENAVNFATSFLNSIGIEGQAERAWAIQLADAFGRYVISTATKFSGAQEQQAERQTHRASQPSSKRRAVQKFQTNDDIFDEETLMRLQQEGAL